MGWGVCVWGGSLLLRYVDAYGGFCGGRGVLLGIVWCTCGVMLQVVRFWGVRVMNTWCCGGVSRHVRFVVILFTQVVFIWVRGYMVRVVS